MVVQVVSYWFCSEGEKNMLWTIVGILLVLWLIGLLVNVGGAFIHILLVIAIIVMLYNFVRGQRNRV